MIALSPKEGVLVGQRGDVLGQAKRSYLAHSTGDLSIQNVAGNTEMVSRTSTIVRYRALIRIDD
jgi:hypothetical protein